MPAGELGSKLRLNWGVFDYSPWGYAEAALRIGGIVIGVCAPAGFVNREKLGDQYASGVFLLLLGLGLIAHFYDRIKLKCVLSLTILFFNVIAHLILGICLLVPDTVSAVFVVLFSGLGTIAQLVRIVDFKIGGYLIDIEVEGLKRFLLWVDCIGYLIGYFVVFLISLISLSTHPLG